MDSARLVQDGEELYAIAQTLDGAISALTSSLSGAGGMAGDDNAAEEFCQGSDGYDALAGPTIDGVRSIEPTLIEAARSYGIPRHERIRRLVLPGALPQIVAGMRTSLSLAVIMLAALLYLFCRAEVIEPVAALVEGTHRVGRDQLDIEIRVTSRGPARWPTRPSWRATERAGCRGSLRFARPHRARTAARRTRASAATCSQPRLASAS